MAANRPLAWAFLPYLAVFLGMVLWRSAWGALIGFHLALLPLVLPNWRTLPTRFRPPVAKGWLLPVALSGLSAGVGLWLVWPLAGLQTVYATRVAALGLTGFIWLPFILYFSLVNPWLEEAFWRQALTSPSKWPAPVDFLFSGYHLLILSLFVPLPWLGLAFLILAGASWFWRAVSHYTESLLPAALSHLLADLSILLVLYLKS